ncbi:NUDIX hydrolase [Gottfriedia solisilvae]|uniref:NUDIX hydrolase n=1 Tax=Gottfriedia solisilvae TaxID=1516104 RepID=UPI002286E49D|nr:8-oxo-dGTP diphosphatase [Gottfriedia solisilvae]
MSILKYTLCFIQRKSELLMLNRFKAPTMGIWNGVGGKIEINETIEESVQREILEETGLFIELDQITHKGLVTWQEKDHVFGGMYIFKADVAEDLYYNTPIKTDEGILDWKRIDWVTDKQNEGVGECIPYFLPILLNDDKKYHHAFYYEGSRVVDVVVKEQISMMK